MEMLMEIVNGGEGFWSNILNVSQKLNNDKKFI